MATDGNRAKAIALTENINPRVFKKEVAFQHIQPSEFIASLKSIIENPQLIKQGGHPICGVSVALKIAAEIDPITLVKMAVNIFVNGTYNPGSFLLRKITVPERILNEEKYNGLNAALFVLQVGIKNFLNRFTVYKANPKHFFGQLQGITYPWQIKRFLTDYFKCDSISKSLYRNDFERIHVALEKGHHVLALTSWNQMKSPNQRFKLLDLHYVLIRGIEKTAKGITIFIDNPAGHTNELEVFTFENDNALRKAIRGIYAYNKRGFKESELRKISN